VAPNDIWRSILYLRANSLEAFKMPPLARNTIDQQGTALLRAWIESLPDLRWYLPRKFLPRGNVRPRPLPSV